ncbi:Fc.00g095830.m01.CDS01 [Cosmosporella sp. VM-42]
MVSLKFLLAFLPLAFSLPTKRDDSGIIPGKYIVTLKPGMVATILDAHLNWVREIHEARSIEKRDALNIAQAIEKGIDKVWDNSFKGYSGEFDKETITAIRKSDAVAAVEPVKVFRLCGTVTQPNSRWGLGSLSHRTANFNEYIYDDSAGKDMWAYVIDTGLNTAHKDFEGRAYLGYNAFPGAPFVDANGHGTHVSGTIVGKVYGVAKKARVMSVKVFHTGSSSTDIVLDGYEWAVKNITSTGRISKSVISMSLAGGRSDAFNAAVETAYKAGILTVVAAGNSYSDAKDYSPASSPNAITVAAIDKYNNKPDFSNYGSNVDIFAAGVGVQSTWIGSNTATKTLSGTSMSCPHVAGLSLYLKAKEGLVSAAALTARIKSLSTKGLVVGPGAGSPNQIAYNGIK